MTDEKAAKSPLQDVLGLVLFVAGAFLAISVAMFWIAGGDGGDANLSTRTMLTVIRAVGEVPGFGAGLLLVGLGCGLFFARGPVPLGRHLAGGIGALLGATFLLGAFRAGGAVGGMFDTLLTSRAWGMGFALAVGSFVLFASVWVAWIPSRRRISMKLGESAPVSAALREGDDAGVSSAEAAALLPVDADSEPIVPAHPIDARLRGRKGARVVPSPLPSPKSSRGAEPPDSPEPAQAGRVAVPRRGAEPVGEDLAAAPHVAPDRAGAWPVADPREAGPRPLRLKDGDRGASVVRPVWETGEARPAAPPEPAEPRGLAGEPAPPVEADWEKSLFEVEDEPEFAWPEPDVESSAPVEVATPEDLVEEALDEPSADVIRSEDEDEEPWEDDDEEDEDEEEEDDDYEDEEEDEEDEEEDEDEDEEEDDEEEDEEDEDEDEEGDDDYEDWDDEDEDEDEEDDDDDFDDELMDSAEPAAGARPQPAPDVELAPAPRRVAPASAPPVRAAKPATPARTRGRGAAAAAAEEQGHGEVLRAAGLMIIETNRVAVSMLQREFSMDFKEATALLDELQERGLIGPYLGGRRRDILLDREEWMARAAAS